MAKPSSVLLASRQSDLARLQAYQVGDALNSQVTDLKVNYHFRESLGDINQDDPLWQMPEKGVFTEDFREGLIQGRWDAVIHSWKDLPVEQEPGTEIIATLPRADVRDVFLCKKKKLDDIKKSRALHVFSSSPRRIYNLSPFLKKSFPGGVDDVRFSSVRGNILTRVRKLIENPEVDGLIVAKAALDRLLAARRPEFLEGQQQLAGFMAECCWQVLPVSENPTAAAQGAIVIEVSSERDDLKSLFQSIHCSKTWDSVQEERRILKSHGGGCHQKIGVNILERDYGKLTFLRGQTEAGEVLGGGGQELKLKLTKPWLQSTNLFTRDPLSYEVPVDCKGHLISRANALPEGARLRGDDVVWAAGLKTWQELAQRGYWVNGSSESLGEQESPRTEALAGAINWCKWTHDSAPVTKGWKRVATYQLRESSEAPDLAQYQEFYWMSGSQFDLATSRQPELLTRDHFCGPGNTYALISQKLKENGIKKRPRILASYQIWQEAIKDFT